VALLVPRLLLWAQTSLAFVAWPWQFDLAEGVNLDASVLLSQGHNIYAHNGPEAFTSAPYTPLFYLLNVPFAWAFGPSFGGGRAISMLATLAAAALLFYVTTRITSVWSAGLLAGAMWLSLSPVIVWSGLYTQSILAAALGFAGLAWTLRCTIQSKPTESQPDSRWLLLAIALFALAFYAKQTAVDAAAATLLWLTIRDPGRGLRMAALFLAFVLVPFAVADIATQGGLWEKVVADHTLSWSDRRAWRIGGRLWSEYWPLLAWAGLFLAGAVIGLTSVLRADSRRAALRGALSSPWALAIYYVVIATTSVLARLGGDGINYNHLLDMLLPVCLLAGLSLGWIIQSLRAHTVASALDEQAGAVPSRDRRKIIFAASGLLLCALLVGAQLFEFTDPHSWYSGMWPDGPRNAQMEALSRLVSGTPGDILSDDAYLLLHNGRRDIYDDTFMLVSLAQLGKWDDARFVQSIRDRRFSLLLLFDLDRWSPEQSQALADNYALKFPDVLSTYVPFVSPASPQSRLSCRLSGPHDTFSLQGYSLAPGVASNGVAPGDVLRTTLYWRSAVPPALDYATYVHLLDKSGNGVAGQDNPRTGSPRPTSAWKAGAVVTDTASIPIPATLAQGRYRLVAGMYNVDPATGALQSMQTACQSGEPYGDGVALGWVDVK
jgi:hypothetical protein